MEKADAIAAWNRRAPSAEAVTMPPYHEGHECCPKCVAEKAVLVSALNGMQEFHDCMEAQRKDEPLPEGHDDPDEACGDGVCYRVGDIIKRGIEVAREVTTAPAKAEVVAARERVCEAAKRFAPTWLTGDQIRNAPAHLKNTALADLLDALAALERARKDNKVIIP